jgi:phosphoribosyl-AMP cyclohydrolase
MEPSDAPDFSKRGGLITAVAQDHASGEILMVAYMNQESFRRTLELGEAVYYSTSRKELWRKGESSGNTQVVKEMLLDCDGDALLLKV